VPGREGYLGIFSHFLHNGERFGAAFARFFRSIDRTLQHPYGMMAHGSRWMLRLVTSRKFGKRDKRILFHYSYLCGGNSNIFWIFTPNLGEDEPIFLRIFFRWVGSTTNQLWHEELVGNPWPFSWITMQGTNTQHWKLIREIQVGEWMQTLKFNMFVPQNGWLEDKTFLLGPCNFSVLFLLLNFRWV